MILDLAVTTVVNGELLPPQIGAITETDVRLTDARTPLTHTHPMTDITGLVAALAILTAAVTALEVPDGSVIDRILTDGAAPWVAGGNVCWV